MSHCTLHTSSEWTVVQSRAIVLLSFEWPENIPCVVVLKISRGTSHGECISVLEIKDKRHTPRKYYERIFLIRSNFGRSGIISHRR